MPSAPESTGDLVAGYKFTALASHAGTSFSRKRGATAEGMTIDLENERLARGNAD